MAERRVQSPEKDQQGQTEAMFPCPTASFPEPLGRAILKIWSPMMSPKDGSNIPGDTLLMPLSIKEH